MQPVKPDLDLLISALEKERRSLKKMIRQAAAELDHLIVYYHSEALDDLNRRLRVLYSFKDPYFEQKEDIKRRIKFWRSGDFMEKLSPRLRERMEKRNEEKAVELEKELQELFNAPQLQPLPDTKFIDEALLALYEKRCRSFRLTLGEEDDYHITLVFKTRKNTLVIQLKGMLFNDEPDFVFEGRTPQPLRAAGFIYDPDRKTHTRTFDFDGQQTIPEIKKWLTKFVIEDSWYYWPGRTMKLEYK
jgi:hypothetical protein